MQSVIALAIIEKPVSVNAENIVVGAQQTPAKKKRQPKQLDPSLNNISIKTFHYNPSPKLIDSITYFAAIHKYDDKTTFKQAWQEWVKTSEIAELMETETQMLVSQGYIGNALDKIYKSARYYYRKKTLPEIDQDGNVLVVEKKKRKKYEGLPSDVLQYMDTHIATQITQHIVSILPSGNDSHTTVCISGISPANAFKHYLQSLQHEYKEKELENENEVGDEGDEEDEDEEHEEIGNANKLDINNDESLKKYKKTYKNRFFLYRNKMNVNNGRK